MQGAWRQVRSTEEMVNFLEEGNDEERIKGVGEEEKSWGGGGWWRGENNWVDDEGKEESPL